jgi:signal transduction histidine kinase
VEPNPIRVLIIDDDPSDALITQTWLEEAQEAGAGPFEVAWVDSFAAGLEAALGAQHDVALVDHELNPGTGIELIRRAVQEGVRTPMILLTGVEARAVDNQALEAGAADFLSKGLADPPSLERSIRYALAHAQALSALARKSRELERSNQELELFARAVSHDLRQPLHVISGYIELLCLRYQESFDDDARNMMGKIVVGVERMNGMIEDLLVLARIDAAVNGVELIDLQALVQEIVEEYEETVQAKAALIRFARLPSLQGRSGHLRQLFRNLLGNALKFTGPEAPVIEVEAQAQGELWHFVVRDNGMGVPEQERERIFEPFVRGSSSERIKGTGIGLALCRKIVQQHGGEIHVEPNEPRGTAMHFTLARG